MRAGSAIHCVMADILSSELLHLYRPIYRQLTVPLVSRHVSYVATKRRICSVQCTEIWTCCEDGTWVQVAVRWEM